MRRPKSRARGLRSIGAIVLLAWLGACGSKEMEREPPPPDRGASEPPERVGSPAVFEGPGQLLPRPIASGYRIASGPRYYDAPSLHRYMDGQADSYLEYGVVRLAVAEYHPAAGTREKTVQIEIYEMRDKLGAFGRWSRLAVEGGDPAVLSHRFVEVGGGSIVTDTDLAFWKGHYLVKLTYLDESPEATEESLRAAGRTTLLPIARLVAEQIPGDAAVPAELGRLPALGLFAHSEVYFARPLFGLEAVGHGWAAEYERGGRRMRLTFAERESADEASAGFDAVRARLGGSAAVAGVGEAAIKGTDPDVGEILLARKGSLIVWVTDSETPGAESASIPERATLARELLQGRR